MTSTHTFLKIMSKLGTEQKSVSKVYRRMLDIDLFVAAYTELATNRGSLTPGVHLLTIDGTSVEQLQQLVDALRDKSFRWTPVRRTEIPKANGKMRKLGIPNWNDRIVQMVLKMVLESYYEPQFSQYSHGFRPNRGCHSALFDIKKRWTGTRWFIEGDIQSCFDSIPHSVILTLLGKRIHDNQLLRLIKDMLKAGYFEKGITYKTYSGTPQGGIVSPLLANIVLHELDEYITQTLIPKYMRGKARRVSREYSRICARAKRADTLGQFEQARTLRKTLRTLSYGDRMDAKFRRLRYTRYADDFILGLIGSKAEAQEIIDQIETFLQEKLGLQLSREKTLITNAYHDRATFLGYEIGVTDSEKCVTHRAPSGRVYKQRSVNGNVQLYVPKQVRDTWVRKYQRNGKPIHRNTYLRYSDFEIINAYGAEWRGFVNYYTLALNVHSLRVVEWNMLQSCQKTLAGKHKTTTRNIRAQFQTVRNGKTCLCCVVEREDGRKPLQAVMGGIPLRIRKVVWEEPNDIVVWEPKYGRVELTRRLLANKCELCDSTEKIQVHHIKSIHALKQQTSKRNLPRWQVHMSARHRNTLVVCQSCHNNIHHGKQDGNDGTKAS